MAKACLPLSLPSGLFLRLLTRSTNRKSISRRISRVIAVALDPLKQRPCASFITLVDLVPDGGNEVLILDGSIFGLPAVLLPVLVPRSHAVDGVLAVGVNTHVLVLSDYLKRSQDRRELRALISLYVAG